MKEQSHKREMDAAVRGDFARLRARGVATTIPVEGDEATETPAPAAGSNPAVDDRQQSQEAARVSLRRLFGRG